jgi:hypothetical protein
LGGLAALVDEAAGQTREVLETKLAQAEAVTEATRLTWNLQAVEAARPALAQPPAGVPATSALWREYVAYYEQRLAAMKAAETAGTRSAVKPPMLWFTYESFLDVFRRALVFQRTRTAALLAEASKQSGPGPVLRKFEQPLIQPNAGVKKADLRFADVLIIEKATGRPPRVETISYKQRNFQGMTEREVEKQMAMDARDAMRFYGGTLDVRTPGLDLRGRPVTVTKVHLVYDATFKPRVVDRVLEQILEGTASKTGVEVRFE